MRLDLQPQPVERPGGGAMVISSLEDLVEAVAAAIFDRMSARDASLISQRDRRGLGGRRHIEAVRRRIAEHKDGAHISGRDYLLTPAALREELARGPVAGDTPRPLRSTRGKSPAAAEREEMARLKRELEHEMNTARRR